MEKGEGGGFRGEICKSQSSAAEILSQHPTPCPSDIPNKTLHPLRLPALAEDAGHLFSKCWAQQVPPAHAAHTRCHPTQTDVTNYTNRELAGAACLLRLSGSSEHSQRGISLFLRLLLLHRLLPVTFFLGFLLFFTEEEEENTIKSWPKSAPQLTTSPLDQEHNPV